MCEQSVMREDAFGVSVTPAHRHSPRPLRRVGVGSRVWFFLPTADAHGSEPMREGVVLAEDRTSVHVMWYAPIQTPTGWMYYHQTQLFKGEQCLAAVNRAGRFIDLATLLAEEAQDA